MRILFASELRKRFTWAVFALFALIAVVSLPHSAYADESNPFLRSGVHTDWESRTVLPDYAQRLYDALEGGSDLDDRSTPNYLIDSKYFSYSAAGDDEIWQHTRYSSLMSLLHITYSDNTERKLVGQELTIQAYTAWAAFRRDHPEVFWLNGMFYYGLGESGTFPGYMDYYLFLRGNVCGDVRLPRFAKTDEYAAGRYGSDQIGSQRIRQGIDLRDKAVAEALASIPAGATDAEKVEAINAFLCQRNTYNKALEAQLNTTGLNYSSNDWECLRCLNPLVGTKGDASIEWVGDSKEEKPVATVPAAPTSEGFAAAFKVLCDAADVDCVIEDGTIDLGISPCKSLLQSVQYSKSTVSHQWNSVEIDGLWYGVDVALNASAYELDPSADAPYLLVGSDTVVDGLAYGASHSTESRGMSSAETDLSKPPKSKPRYNNGPVLTNQAYTAAPFRFKASSAVTGGSYGTRMAAASELAKSFTFMLDGAPVTDGHWEWIDAKPMANDTDDFFLAMRYVDDDGVQADGSPRTLATALVPFSIERKTVKVSLDGAAIASKIIDGSAQATFSTPPTLTGVLAGDNVVLKTEAYFEDAEAGAEKDVIVTYRLMGADACHYKLTTPSVTMYAAADIIDPDHPFDPNKGSTDANKPSNPSVPGVSAEPTGTPSGATSTSGSKPTASGSTSAQKPLASTGNPSAKPTLAKPKMKATKIVRLKSAKKKLTVTWKKAAGTTSGYQIQYALDKKFKKSAKTKYVKGASKQSAKLTSLKAKKKYYVRVRTVYKKGGKTYYGPWSAVKSARTK